MDKESFKKYVDDFMMGSHGGVVKEDFMGMDVNEMSRDELLYVVYSLMCTLELERKIAEVWAGDYKKLPSII